MSGSVDGEQPGTLVDELAGERDDGTEEEPNSEEKRARIAAHLREETEEGLVYTQSRDIAEEVGLSPKEVGALLKEACEENGLDIEEWGRSSATTWKVTRTEGEGEGEGEAEAETGPESRTAGRGV